MAIGHLGSTIKFSVSEDKILTFRKMTRKTSGRWATHDTIGSKPKSEFLGPDLREASLEIYLSAAHGVKPYKTLKKIAAAIEDGTPLTFVVGGKRVGYGSKWVITNSSEEWNTVFSGGELVAATVSITLREYF